MMPFIVASNSRDLEKMSACLVGSWAKIPNGEDGHEMAENIFLNRNNIALLPVEKNYLSDFREKHPEVKAALVDGIEYFDDQYFGTGESEAICMDPQQRMLMQGVIKGLENAGITLEMASEARVAVYTAAWCYDYKDLLPPDQYMATGNSASVMCGRITYFLNSRGAAVGIETACSSSLVAFHLARQAIQSGETKLALVCGANHVGSRSFHSLYNSHMVSPNGRLAAFDRSANGFVRAESFAVAVLCSKQFAEENNLLIHCECVGSAFNSDGKTPSLTAPNPISQYEVQLEALKNIDKDSVQLVTCHGTGTKLGDQVELTAINRSFKSDIRVMSPKSSMGHGEGAAGLIGVLQSLYSMQHGIIPNQLHLELPSEDLGEDKSMGFVNEEMELNRVAISSYGFGGTNACAIIEKPEKPSLVQKESYAESNVLFLSAKSHESLKLQIEEYTQFMAQSDSAMEDILYTVNERKTKYDFRAAVFGKDNEEIARKLQDGDYSLTNLQESTFEVEFGEGNEKLWLLRMLYEKNETFHSTVDKYCKLAETCGFPEARTALFFPFKLTLTPLTYNVSRLISSMATFELLVQYNTLPNKLRGKGLGQIFCLAVAKVITFESAVQLIKGVVAEANLTDILGDIELKSSKIPIEIQHLKSTKKKILPIHISGELKETAKPNLMTFIVNGEEILELDPVRKVQKLICQLFACGFDPAVKFRGRIVKTPTYSFLKRQFWPEVQTAMTTNIVDEQTNSSLSDAEIESTVRTIVKQFLDIEEDDINLLETGAVDSLTSIEMVEAFGTAVNQTMPFDLLEAYPTILNIVDFLKTLVTTVPVTKATTSIHKKTSELSTSDINVIACDYQFAGVEGEKELWDTLLTSRLTTGKISDIRKKQCEGDAGLEVGLLKQDISMFDNSFFAIAKDEAEFLDPQHRLLLNAAYNALEKSGLTSIPDADLFLAISAHSEYRALAEKHINELDERLWMGTVHSMVAGRLAVLMGIRGRAMIVDTTCSSVATALEMAVKSIREGRKFAIVATSQLIQSSKWLYSLKTLLDHHSTNSFSVDGSGFCRSDGVGVIILKTAEKGDSAVIKISSAKSHHCGAVMTPVVSSISQLLEEAGSFSYVEGHGTATSAGDSAESMAYQKLGSELIMSSVKAQFGHCEVASGLIQLMKVSSIGKHGIIPSIVHNILPSEHIRNNENIRLPFVAEEKQIDRSAIVSFGITGTKTVVTTERVSQLNVDNIQNCYLLPVSAKTKDGLKKACLSLIEMIDNSCESLYDISTTLQKQKTNFKWRTAVVGSSHADVVLKLKQFLTSEHNTSLTNWHISTSHHSIGCSTFFHNIPEFEDHYSMFCHRLRFEPHSNTNSIYHLLAVVYALIRVILKHKLTNSFAVGGFNSLIVLAAVDAAPSHYLNDLLHAFANDDVRMMKRIARDVTISIENVKLLNLNGEPITTARQAVEATIDQKVKNVRLPETTLILSPSRAYEFASQLETIQDYYKLIGEKFTQGGQVDFAGIFGTPIKLIDLPEYPFNRKSFWLPIPDSVPSNEKGEKPLIPKSYEFLLKSQKWQHVQNHVVDSKIVLPGATSIRLVHQLNGKPTVELSNIDFLNKITPSEAPSVVKIEEQDGLEKLVFGETDAISFKLTELQNFNPIPNERLNAEVHHTDNIYERFANSHLTYRNEFQMVDSLKYTMGKGEVRFVSMKDLDILIDGTLQAIVGCYFFENTNDNSPFVPFTIDQLSILNGDISQKQLHAVLKYDSSGNFINGDATVYDALGNIILHISNVTFKRLNGQSAPSLTSKTVDSSKITKKVENEDQKRASKNMLHVWFEENFGWTDIDNTTGFFDLGLTSIQAVKLRNAIKSNYPNASSTCVFDYPSIDLLSGYLSTLNDPQVTETSTGEDDIQKDLTEDHKPTRLAENPIGVMAAACRLPGGVSSPSELWELLKIGKNASSRIPATRVPTRNTLISGSKYGNPVEGGNFITQDVTQFDPSFFKISKSEAELIDPQQRLLLECVQECLENSGVIETSNVGVFVGLMEKEYQDMMESSSILAMLGSMAAVIAGRVNYIFGCYGPSVTIDTACSSSLVALEMAINALLDNRCSKVIVAGVNLILNEKGQGLRTNGKMLSQHGMSLSFDSRASGYGRSDGCVVLMLELAKPNFHYMSTIQSVNVNHGGRSVSLTAPNGVAHKMLLTSVINQSPSLAIDYWEAHGTGTPLGDPIEFNTLSSILQNIIIGSVKASLGHGEASAGTCGLLKLFLMLTYQYVPTLIHFHVLNKDINAGSIRLPIIGEDSELVSAGISSFGVSGTNAAAIAFNDNNKLEPYIPIHKYYILPISAKNQISLDNLEKQILSVIPLTDVPICNIASALANNRSHFTIRNALIVSNSGIVNSKMEGKPHRVAKKDRYHVKLCDSLLDASLLQYDVINETYTVASLKNPQSFAMKFAIIKFLTSLSEYIEIVASDGEELLAVLLANGSLKWENFNKTMIELPIGSLLTEFADHDLNSTTSSSIKSYQTQPESHNLDSPMELMKLIMKLYITGYDVDWATVYSPVEQFIALPNYQFNKQTLWFEERLEIVDHYLIGTIDEESEDTLILKNQISELRHPQFFKGKPLDVGTMSEIAIEALKIRNEIPFSIQNLKTELITLTKPAWLETNVTRNEDDEGFNVSAYIDGQRLFSLNASSVEIQNIEVPAVEVQIPDKVVYLKECPNAVIRRHRNMVYVDSRAEQSPFRTANIVLNEIIGFAPTPSDMFIEILGVLPSVHYMVQVDDGALWQFQMISQDKRVLSNIYVLKDAKGLEIPTIRMHKKSTLLSSQEASIVAAKTLQMAVRHKVCLAVGDVIESGLDIDESQLSTGFSELGIDSLATVDLLNRLNQKYFPEIELTTSDLFDNPSIIDLSIMIEQLLNEKGITEPSEPNTPKTSLRGRKLSIPAVRAQVLAQIEFVENYNSKQKEVQAEAPSSSSECSNHLEESDATVDRTEIRRKVSLAVFDLATETLSAEDLQSKGFTELGMDSLSIVDFVNRLNDKYFPDDEITASDIFDYPTVDELSDHIVRKKSSSVPPAASEIMKETMNGISTSVDAEHTKLENLSQSFMLLENQNSINPTLKMIWSNQTIKLVKPSDGNFLFELNANGGQEKEIQKHFTGPNNIIIDLKGFHEGSTETLYMSLLNLVKSISKLEIQCRFGVSQEFGLGNSISRAFMKTVAAEKNPLISFAWYQNVQQVSFVDSDSPITGNWLITGGLSGIGLEIGKFIANNGAENVILISRRQPTAKALREFEHWKSKVHTIAADINDKEKLIRELTKLNVGITGIIHSAGVLKDSKIERQNKESFNQVFTPKANGFHVLEEIEKHFNYKIENFIMMSSFTAACGNEGQLNYGVSNAYLEYQVQRRRRQGKSGCAIQWGNWIDTGMATDENVRKFLANLGFLGQHNKDALKYLRACILTKPELIMVANIDWNVILKNRKDLPKDLINTGILPFEDFTGKMNESEFPLSNGDFEKVSMNFSVEDEEEVLELIKEKVSSILMCSPTKLKNNKNIMDMGLDSKLIVEFLNFINSTFKISVNLSDAYNHPTLEKLAAHIFEQMTIVDHPVNSVKSEEIFKSTDFCPIFGINIFFDNKNDFDKAKSTAVKLLENGEQLPTAGKYAVSVVGKSIRDVVSKIKEAAPQQIKLCQESSKCVLMLTGQGSQYPMMGRQLVENYEIFRTTLQSCLKKCDEYLQGDVSLWEILFNTDHYKLLQLTKHMQPIMFCFGYATAQLWLSLGIVPDYYLGHSVGELVAGVLAGIMSIEDGLRLIVERGKAMENIAGLGALLAVQREIADEVLRKFKVSVATINSPKQVVFAGTKSVLDAALAFVKGQGKQATYVNQQYPFHSNLIQETHLVSLRQCLADIKFSAGRTPLVSNVTGQIINTFSEAYIVKHTVSAVKFVDCVETLQAKGVTVWIDAGSAAVLATFVKRIIQPTELSKHRIVQTCKEKESDVDNLVQACLELEQSGLPISWTTLYGCGRNADERLVEFPMTHNDIIKNDEFELLEGHQLNGKIVVAGAYQLFKIDQLVKLKAAGMELMLKNVKFLKPWYIEDNREYQIQWNSDMTIELIVNSVIVCSLEVEPQNSVLKLETISENEKPFEVHDFYETLFRNGLQYDSGFRRIESARRSDKRCFSQIKSSPFAWPLIDSAMHSITASVVPRRPDCYFLPVAMGSVTMKDTNSFTLPNLHAQTVITSETDKFIQVNVALLAGDTPICEVRNMTIVVLKTEPVHTRIPNSIETVETPPKSEIEIVGFDISLPYNQISENSENWQHLKTNTVKQKLHNRSLKQDHARVALLDSDARYWDPEYFGIRPSEAKFIDPQQRLLLCSVAKLLDSLLITSLTSNTGVFIGCSANEFSHIVYAYGYKDPRAEWSGGTSNSALAGRIAHWLKLKGPVVTLDTACSSSFYALSAACDALRTGQCEYAIVGTVNLVMHEMTTDVLQNAKMTVDDFCKAFDVDANGYKRSEAVCSMLLTKSPNIDSVATITNYATGHNGTSSSLFTPNGLSQLEVMQRATNPLEKILEIQTHCTGTKLGDPIEINAISKLVSSACKIGSVKSNIGHTEGSSGLVSLCSSLMSFRSKYRVAQLHLKCPTNSIKTNKMICRFIGEDADENNSILINNFGFTGSNCSVVLKPKNAISEHFVSSEVFYPILLSSHSAKSLQKYVQVLCEFISNSAKSLHDIMMSLFQKKIHVHRQFIIFNFKRKIAVTSLDGFVEVRDERLEKLKHPCSVFLKEGVVHFDKDKSFQRVDLPSIVFNNTLHWALDSYRDEIDRHESQQMSFKNIFYEKVLLETPMPQQNPISKVVCIGRLDLIPKIEIDEVSSFANGIIVFHPISNSIFEYLKLAKVWSLISRNQNVFIIICCFENGTSHTEWTGTLRSLASEKMIPYKFVSIDKVDALKLEFNHEYMFEAIFYSKRGRYVERLRKVNPTFKFAPQYEKCLISGGTGGIGSAIINELKPKSSVIITRKNIASEDGKTFLSSDITRLDISHKFNYVFHLAGIVNNSLHENVKRDSLDEMVSIKLQGAKNLMKCCDETSHFVFSSSIANVLGSYGQSNYAFSNGLVTSFLETSSTKSTIIHWGPWKDVGMLAQPERREIVKQIESNGWKLLPNQDAISVFYTQFMETHEQIIVFDGDFDTIVARQPHLQKLLSEVVEKTKVKEEIKKKSLNFEEIFFEIVGITDISSKLNIPFMDLGIDSLCMENLRYSLNKNFDLELTVSEMFENATYQKLQTYVETLRKAKHSESLSHDRVSSQVSNKEDDTRVAVIGWSAEFSGSSNIHEYWENLMDGICSTGNNKYLLKNPFGFDNKFFNLTDEDARVLDPQVRKFIQHAYLALENSGYVKQKHELRCGVFAGAEPSDYGRADDHDDAMRKLFVMNMNSYLASYASYCLDLKGEAVSVYSACSTALVAVANAVKSIQSGSMDYALVGAASIAEVSGALSGFDDQKKTMFSKSGVCRPFDKDSEGIVRGSGVGCFVLKRYSQALLDNDNVHFVIKDFAINNDGHSRASFMAPNPAGQLKCMTDVLARFTNKEKERISFVECHATGTTLGDTIEMNSLRTAYSFKNKLAIGSCKANIGHAYAASGLAALVKCAKMLQTGIIPPQVNFSEFRDGMGQFFTVNGKKSTISQNSLISIDSFGIGGTNVHMVIEFPARSQEVVKISSENLILYDMIPISAKTEYSLDHTSEAISKYLQTDTNKIAQCSSTFIHSRVPMDSRTYLSVNNNNELLKIRTNKKTWFNGKSPKIALFFAPQGIQFTNILPNEYLKNSAYRREVEYLCELASSFGIPSLEGILYPTKNFDHLIHATQFAQIAIFVQCMAIFKAIKNVFNPTCLIGHSVGEYAAAVISGALKTEEALKLLIKRSELIGKTEKARMLMVWNYEKQLPSHVHVSAIIDANTKCVVGPVETIDNLEKYFINNHIKYRNIETKHGFHSKMFHCISKEFEFFCESFATKVPLIPMISSITGSEIKIFDSKYCTMHLTNPVNLELVVDHIMKLDIDIIVEVGPTGVLSNLLAKRNSKIVVVPTCGTKKHPKISLGECIGQLWSNGVDIRKLTPKLAVDGQVPGYCFDERQFGEKNQKISQKLNRFSYYKESWKPVSSELEETKPVRFTVCDGSLNGISEPVLVYLLRKSEDIHKNYFDVELFLKSSPRCSTVVFVGMDNSPSVHLSLGLIRCYQLVSRIDLKYVENFENIAMSIVIQKVLTANGLYFRIDSTGLCKHGFRTTEIPSRLHPVSRGHALVFGANGFIGSIVFRLLQEMGMNVIPISRASIPSCDITNIKDVQNVFKSLGFKKFSVVINCVGVETSAKMNKTSLEQEIVLSPKTFGSVNILKCLEEFSIEVDKLVNFSSLSSVVPLLGNFDYASANCFVEALTKQGSKYIKQFLTLSLPPLEGSRMYESSTSSTKHNLSQILMFQEELTNVLKTAFESNMNGIVFVSSVNPADIATKSIAFHRTDENGSEVKAVESLKLPKSTSCEFVIAEIWKETLGISILNDANPNFFSLGGDSLSALQVVWKVQKKTDRIVDVNDLFDNPTLQEFTKFVKNLTTEKFAGNTNDKISYDAIPLTNSQTQMFMLRQIDTTSKYNLIFKITISYETKFVWEFLKYSLHSLIAYQPSYRTVFKSGNSPYQYICSLTESFHDFDKRCNLNNAISHEPNHLFEIGKSTPLRVRVAEDCDNSRIHIVFNQHHILTDGWSMTVLSDTVSSLYAAYRGETSFPSKTKQTISQVAMGTKSSGDIKEALEYYQNTYHTIIPYDSETGNTSPSYVRISKLIPSKIWQKLVGLSKLYNTTMYNLALSVFCDAVRSFTGQADILLAYAISGRNADNSELIGYFMNNALFKTSLPFEILRLEEILNIVLNSLEKSRSFATIPFYQMVEQNRKLNEISLFFNFRQKLDYPTVSMFGAKCEIEHLSLNNAFDFSFTIDETPTGSLITVDFDKSKYLDTTVHMFANIFLKKLNNLRNMNTTIPIRRTDFPSTLFQKGLFTSWRLFTEPALLLSTNTVSYSDLAEKIENISKDIQKQLQIAKATSVREDELVGLDCKNSYFALLACVFLGLPYAPIDPTWPEPRQLFVKSKVSFTLENCFSCNLKLRNFNSRTQFGSIYSIFTSGSTGVPKGVLMAEQSVSSFMTSASKQCMFRSNIRVLDSVKQVFDVSVSNIIGSVLNGGVLISSEHSTTITDQLQKCQYAFLPAAVFNGFTDKTMSRLESIETLTIGGETVSDVVIETAMKKFPRLRTIQIYGPTETCIWSLTNKCKVSTLNIGSALGDSLSNETCTICNNSVRGNVQVKGISLARGYITSAPHGTPFSDIYSTGDIVDSKLNSLQYIGRMDSQVKCKGVRINISEIEKELILCLGLLQIVVLYSNQMLIAFIVDQKSKLLHDSLVKTLKNRTQIPDYFVQINKMPLNSSGKVDKSLLLQAFENIRKSYKREIVVMKNSLEEKVINVFSKILGRNVAPTDKFESIGGNSLNAIQIAHRLAEELKIEIKAHEILQSNSLKTFCNTLKNSVQKPISKVPNVITKLREVPNSKFNIYLVHAIGGTIYPYYSFLQIFPKDISLYGIEFDLKYPSNDLRELAHFYAEEIAAHAGNKRIFVMGHSMGGIMSREIVAELKIWGYDIPFVMLFDSWVLRTNELDIENIKQFITYVFSGLPDSEHRINRAIKLAQLLREYKTSVSDTKLYLFKSKQLGDAAFKKAVRSDLNEELSRSMTCNGFDELSLQPVETYLIDGDHESCLKAENLKKVKDLVLAPFQPYFEQA